MLKIFVIFLLFTKIYSSNIDEDKDEELVLKTDYNLTLDSNWHGKNRNNSNLVQLVRVQLKKEIRKLKSTITDSIMEEVINYYGKKLELTDELKVDYESLNKKYNTLSQSLNQLGQSFKTISKNHRNLVDIVRNNMLASKKEAAEKAKIFSSSSVNSNLKKKSIDSSRLALSGLNNQTNTGLNKLNNAIESNRNKLKLELLNDLETKYSNLFDDKLADILLRNLKNDSSKDENETDFTLSTRASSTTTRESNFVIESHPSDCEDVRREGFIRNDIFKVTSLNDPKINFNVYCEFEDNIGWTVLQRRQDGSVNFYQNWNAYKNGFGNMEQGGEFWLGLENMHLLTNQQNYSLQVVMTDWKDEKYVAEYENFRINSETTKYKLELSGYMKVTSNAGDSLSDSLNNAQSHNGMAFSTFDSDNDMRFYDNCAQIFKSGWWFNACFQSNLNGIYYKYSSMPHASNSNKLKKEENPQLRFLRNGIHWNSIDFYKSLKSTKLRIRRHK